MLSNQERDDILKDFHRDGFVHMPMKLPAELHGRAEKAIDEIAASDRKATPGKQSVKRHNAFALHQAFRDLVMWAPALQLSHDLFGPSFQLNQSNLIDRIAQPDDGKYDAAAGIAWHADGPRPAMFPRVQSAEGPAVGLHYFKLGYFLTDVGPDDGPLKVIRGSHRKDELCSKPGFTEADCGDDLVECTCPAGTVIAFHQALWHAADRIRSSNAVRKNLYVSYSPTWMKPLDYDLPRPRELPESYSAEERWMVGEYREPLQFWLPNAEQKQRFGKFARQS